MIKYLFKSNESNYVHHQFPDFPQGDSSYTGELYKFCLHIKIRISRGKVIINLGTIHTS